MNLTTIDSIVRRGLLENSLPIHYYAEFLFSGSTCLRELNFDTLQIVNTANLPVDDTGAVNLPDGFVDDIIVAIPSGQGLINLPKQDWITPLRIHDTTSGEFVPYTDGEDVTSNIFPFYGFRNGWSFYWNVDSYGSFTGRNFGGNGGTALGYKVVKERRQIQLTEGLTGTSVVLMFISDGQSIDAASQIDYLAFQTIRAYQEWKRSPNRNNDNSPEGRAFYNQKRLLRARLNPMTPTDIINILRSAYTAGLKF